MVDFWTIDLSGSSRQLNGCIIRHIMETWNLWAPYSREDNAYLVHSSNLGTPVDLDRIMGAYATHRALGRCAESLPEGRFE